MYRHLQILVAEDNQDDAYLLKRAFLRAGINAPMEFVANGELALDYLHGRSHFANREEHPMPRLLILDLRLPGIDGFAVLQGLRENPQLRRLPVIVLTCLGDKSSIDRAHELGVNGYLTKPASPDGFDSLVASLEDWWLKRNQYPAVEDSAWDAGL